MDTIKGSVIKLPDNVDTDIIIPTQYMTLPTVEEMTEYAFSPLRPDIPSLVKKGDVLVCGKNFGCGSSREQAPEIIIALGISCVVAVSFARIFYRNAINNGLLVIENAEIYNAAKEGDSIEIDIDARNAVINGTKKITIGKIPQMLLDMIETGGLVDYHSKINREGK